MALVRVTNIQHGCVNDGPGVRTTVFLKGCPLRCPWCCNPETQSIEHETFVDETKCIYLKGETSLLCKECVNAGGREPISKCRFGVYEGVDKDYTEEELIKEILIDRDLYKMSNGGVTFSGGEPLMQSEALVPIMKKLKENGISIALESTIFSPQESIEKIAPFVDCWIVDLKLQPEMFLGDTQYLYKISNALGQINNETNVIYRLVFVNSLEGRKREVLNAFKTLGVKDVELLQAHDLGRQKYKRLNRTSEDFSADPSKLSSFATGMQKEGINTKILSI